jgi:glycosyltransferase involved in cell wall biosynthesis
MPKSSVVVASTRDRAALDRFLAILLPPCASRAIEVVVARNCTPDEYRELEKAWPAVLFMPAPDNATTRQLRIAGASAAEGDIVTFIEDDAAPSEDWLADLPAGAGPEPVES